jgi:hypothetical protein
MQNSTAVGDQLDTLSEPPCSSAATLSRRLLTLISRSWRRYWKFDVWYDDWSLVVGPSLLRQISKGLQQCQYGIVILSKHFFEKKWPKAELDGLFDLEPADHSLILQSGTR